jgi:tetratricopeptide (TPR) repeat protein
MLRRLLAPALLVVAFSGSWVVVRAQDDDTKSAPQSQRDDSRDSTRETEMSSSKDTRIDLSPPKDDAKNHPDNNPVIIDEETASDVDEMHPWDPHKAAKDIEVGDYYFKRKNYKGALERYKDALVYKPSDAVANFRLAECEEKVGNSSDAVEHYQAYLKILPNGPFAADARKALDRLKPPTTSLR